MLVFKLDTRYFNFFTHFLIEDYEAEGIQD